MSDEEAIKDASHSPIDHQTGAPSTTKDPSHKELEETSTLITQQLKVIARAFQQSELQRPEQSAPYLSVSIPLSDIIVDPNEIAELLEEACNKRFPNANIAFLCEAYEDEGVMSFYADLLSSEMDMAEQEKIIRHHMSDILGVIPEILKYRTAILKLPERIIEASSAEHEKEKDVHLVEVGWLLDELHFNGSFSDLFGLDDDQTFATIVELDVTDTSLCEHDEQEWRMIIESYNEVVKRATGSEKPILEISSCYDLESPPAADSEEEREVMGFNFPNSVLPEAIGEAMDEYYIKCKDVLRALRLENNPLADRETHPISKKTIAEPQSTLTH